MYIKGYVICGTTEALKGTSIYFKGRVEINHTTSHISISNITWQTHKVKATAFAQERTALSILSVIEKYFPEIKMVIEPL